MKRLELTLHGTVQGVNFRAEATRKARGLGLTGTVRNNPDGTVSIVAEGLERKLKVFRDWAKAGPPAAEVRRHGLSWETPTGDFEGFSIIY